MGKSAENLDKSSQSPVSSDSGFGYREVLESIDAITWEFDLIEHKWVYVSENASRILGQSLDLDKGLEGWFEHIYPDDLAMAIDRTRAAINKVGKHVYEYRYLRGDKSVIWLRNVAHIAKQNQVPVKIIGYTVNITAEKNSEELLLKNEERYRSLFENSHTANLIIDPQKGNIVEANAAAIDFYGWSKTELTRMNICQINTKPREEVLSLLKKAAMSQRSRHLFVHRLKNGSTRNVEIYAGGIFFEGRTMVYTFILDITERITTEEKLKKILAEKEILMRELQHRVKNNLNVIASLLSLEKNRNPGIAACNIIDNMSSRIKSIALIYERLYLSTDLVRVDLNEYLNKLIVSLLDIFGRDNSGISYDLNIENYFCHSGIAVPLGLILNELLTNSLKYAFSQQPEGKITISLAVTENLLELVVADNGCGLPEGLDLAKASSMGLLIINSLVCQLGASLSWETSGGTTAKLQIPLDHQIEQFA